MNDKLVSTLLQHKKEIIELDKSSHEDNLKFSTDPGNHCIRVCIGKSDNMFLDRGYNPSDFGYSSYSTFRSDIIKILQQQSLHYINQAENLFHRLFKSEEWDIEY